jgi:LuxR family maltose regulon positive regulatory protein
MHVELTEQELALVDERTEGWLVGLQLVGLSLQGRHSSGMSADLLEVVSGQRGYILDYLTEEVLRSLPEPIQLFLLRTSILDRLTAALCDAVMLRQDSQQMLETLERRNLFVVSLDRQRRWYRYHALFAEALRYLLEQREGEAIQDLHLRASQWYAGQGDVFEAVRHALQAQAWLQVADLIEHFDYTLVWRNERAMFLRWVEMLPPELLRRRPRLCLIYAHALLFVASPGTIESWLQTAETVLTGSLAGQTDQAGSQSIEGLHNVLGAIPAFRAFIASVYGDASAALLLCQRAFDHLSEQNVAVRAEVAVAKHMAHFSLGEFVPAIEEALEASTLFEAVGIASQAIYMLNSAAYCLICCGHLHEAWGLLEQAAAVGSRAGGFLVPSMGVILAQQAEISREWNQLDAALDFGQRAVQLVDQIDAAVDLVAAYCTLVSISLARGEYDGVSLALQQVERVEPVLTNSFIYANYISITRVRNWLARGDLEQAVRWSQEQRETGRYSSPFAREREAVALVRVWLAQNQPEEALSHLEPLLEAATRQDRWGNVIELLLLTALAHQQRHEEQEWLAALTEAIRLAEPEGYMRMFVDEGPPMAALLSTLRMGATALRGAINPAPTSRFGQPGKDAMAGYLDRVLAAFPAQSKIDRRALQQPLPEPLSAREREVLSLLARGASNQEIAETLVVALDTVKRHVSNILSKLTVSNRTQAVVRARALGLLSEEEWSA